MKTLVQIIKSENVKLYLLSQILLWSAHASIHTVSILKPDIGNTKLLLIANEISKTANVTF